MINLKDVLNYLEKKIKMHNKIVIGLSGGPDSMCLLSLLLKLKEKMNLTIICCHVNHNIRKESEEEAEFVKEYVIKNNCIYEYFKIDNYDKENFESNARKKRYQFFNEIIKKYQAEYLMTAHHGDDLTETILMRLIRGSNLNGYGGFKKETKYQNYQLLRPLINTTKKEIENYNHQNNIEYRIDKTNQDEKYTRARYRTKILPLLKKENPNVHQKFLTFSEEIYLVESYLEKETNKILTKVLEFDKVNLRKFNELNLLFKKRILEHYLKKEYKNDINILNKNHLQKILEICHSRKANLSLNLPKKKILVKSYNYLYFSHKPLIEEKNIILKDYIKLNNNEEIKKITECDIEKSNFILRLNSQEVKIPLYIRYRKNGDYIEIKNLGGRKKIKDIFINEKIPLLKRATWPIVVDSQNKVLWIPGIKKSKFDKNINEFYDIIYEYVISEEKKDTYDE